MTSHPMILTSRMNAHPQTSHTLALLPVKLAGCLFRNNVE